MTVAAGTFARTAASALSIVWATVARTINDAEAAVRAKVPAAKVIYLEPDLDRGVQR